MKRSDYMKFLDCIEHIARVFGKSEVAVIHALRVITEDKLEECENLEEG